MRLSRHSFPRIGNRMGRNRCCEGLFHESQDRCPGRLRFHLPTPRFDGHFRMARAGDAWLRRDAGPQSARENPRGSRTFRTLRTFRTFRDAKQSLRSRSPRAADGDCAQLLPGFVSSDSENPVQAGVARRAGKDSQQSESQPDCRCRDHSALHGCVVGNRRRADCRHRAGSHPHPTPEGGCA